MKAKGLFTFLAMAFLASAAKGITLQDAKNAVDSVYSRHVSSHYLHYQNFWDGTNQRIAYALARSGDTLSNGCGRSFVNENNLAVTFEMATDSAGAYEEGTTALRLNPSIIPTLDSAQAILEIYWYNNDRGAVSGVAGSHSEKASISYSMKEYPNPITINAQLNLIGLKPNSAFIIENILGQRIHAGSANDNGEYHSNSLFERPLSRGIYFLKGIDQKTNKPHSLRMVVD